MAQLIVTRGAEYFGFSAPFQIVIDDQCGAPIHRRQTIGIELPPGRHEVMAKIGAATSGPVQIDAELEGRHHLKVASRYPNWQFAIQLIPAAWMMAIVGRGMFQEAPTSLNLMYPTAAIVFASLLTVVQTLRFGNQVLTLERLPDPGVTFPGSGVRCDVEFQHADLSPVQPVQPFRVRFTVRGLMIAVALLALMLWLGLGSARRFKVTHYASKARMHAEIEAIWRKGAQEQQALDERVNQAAGVLPQISIAPNSSAKKAQRLKQISPVSTRIRSFAAKSAALADYHQAMKQKYERAAALGLLSVEPDPPQPPMP